MKKKLYLALLCSTGMLAGWKNISPEGMVNSGLTAVKAVSLSDEDVRSLSNQSCADMDKKANLAAADSIYSQRIERIASRLGGEVKGVALNYKVYQNPEPNAWAMANGCVRIYTGLLDLMTDNEVEGVLGHEIGHVALGHSKKAMQTAYAASAARGAAASSGNADVEALSSSKLGALSEALINAQFSQSQESAADDFSFDLLTERGVPRDGLVTAFEKLATLSGGKSSMFSSHPGSQERADRMRSRLTAAK